MRHKEGIRARRKVAIAADCVIAADICVRISADVR
jgi:hypothetical protein